MRVAIRGEFIELGQLLKYANLVSTGGEAKAMLASGKVFVNDLPESRRGRKLYPGDRVRVEGALDPIEIASDGDPSR